MINSGEWDIAVCGLNCAKCDMYQASHGNEALRDEIVEWFRKERNEVVDPERIRCETCRGPVDSHWSPECRMMLCAKARGLRHCFECVEFPCSRVDEFSSDGVPHHGRTIENQKRMRKIGLDAWIEAQKRKGQCVFCP